jgi:hypothetical protein
MHLPPRRKDTPKPNPSKGGEAGGD